MLRTKLRLCLLNSTFWFKLKQDFDKASKILNLVTAVMHDPLEGIGRPEPLKYIDANI